MIEGGCRIARVPDEHCVDQQLQAKGVAVVVVLVGGKLCAGADHEVPTQGVQGLALIGPVLGSVSGAAR